MKRLCIYLTYDRQKIVDKYIGYMLKELKTCVNYLVVVCNEKEIVRGMDVLEEYADEIYFRENIGLDAGGFKDALSGFIGWDRVYQYDELVLVNDSMFGPFCPMKDIFAGMDNKSADFWGLAIHGEGRNHVVGYVHEHVQSYFYVIRSRMLHSSQFMDYWNNMPYFTSMNETIAQYEIGFTRHFSNLGYTYDALADTKANDSVHSLNNYSQYALIPFEMIQKRNFPFLKRQPLAVNTLYCQTQQNLRQAIDYIDQETDYDVNLIWDNIIRVYNMTDLQQTLHLQYIVSEESAKPVNGSVALVVFIGHRESEEYVLEYLQKLESKYSVYIFAENVEYLEIYRMRNFICQEISIDDFATILWKFREFDFICVLHDTDVTSEIEYSCTGKSYFYNVWENLLKDARHVRGVIDRFTREPRLGFLTSPQPLFGNYFGEYGVGWNGRLKKIQHMVKEAGLNCQISGSKPPFRVTDSFWTRGCILKKLCDIRKKDTMYLPYIWILLAQDSGYYSGIIESKDYASMNEVNLQYYLRKLADQVMWQCGTFHNFDEMQDNIRICALKIFCEKYTRIIVYGAGEEARLRRNLLPDIEAYIVSDGQEKPQEINGIRVKYLSEIEVSADCGIVLCLNRTNQMEVIPLLEARGIGNYFCM